VKVIGLERSLKNLNKAIEKIEGASVDGLLAAGLIVQGEAQKIVPVEFGNLRGSAFTRKAQKKKKTKPSVEVGFSAAYALYVHENLNQTLKGLPRPPSLGKAGIGFYWGPKGEPKYLENALRRNRKRVLKAIAAHAKIKTKKARR